MQPKFEYVKCFWDYIDKETPVLLFYEVDLENERYATRMAEVFCDREVKRCIEKGFDYITEAPIPSIEEINQEPEFYAERISQLEFEAVYHSHRYVEELSRPKQ